MFLIRYFCNYVMKLYNLTHQTGKAVVVINIEDENDEAPIFEQMQYEFEVYENNKPGTEIGVVVATDKDSFPNNQIGYELIENGDYKVYSGYHEASNEIAREDYYDAAYQIAVKKDSLFEDEKFFKINSTTGRIFAQKWVELFFK